MNSFKFNFKPQHHKSFHKSPLGQSHFGGTPEKRRENQKKAFIGTAGLNLTTLGEQFTSL